MPEVKNYSGKGKKDRQAKRRPHHEANDAMMEAEELKADEINTEAQNEGLSAPPPEIHEEPEAEMLSEGAPTFNNESSEHKEEKVHLEFYGSEMIRMKAPKVMEIADTVADEWVKDGSFEGLPVGNPLAQIAAAKALRTAKDVEKKLEEKGVIAMAKMGFEFVKSKIEKRNQ